MCHCTRYYKIRSAASGRVAARFKYENKVKGLHDTKPHDWRREVKQLCGTAKATGCDLRTTLLFDDNFLSEMVNEAFVAWCKLGYSPLSENDLVASGDDEPLSVTEATIARKLRAMSSTCAGGPDNLPNWVADILASLHWYIKHLFPGMQISSCV